MTKTCFFYKTYKCVSFIVNYKGLTLRAVFHMIQGKSHIEVLYRCCYYCYIYYGIVDRSHLICDLDIRLQNNLNKLQISGVFPLSVLFSTFTNNKLFMPSLKTTLLTKQKYIEYNYTVLSYYIQFLCNLCKMINDENYRITMCLLVLIVRFILSMRHLDARAFDVRHTQIPLGAVEMLYLYSLPFDSSTCGATELQRTDKIIASCTSKCQRPVFIIK